MYLALACSVGCSMPFVPSIGKMHTVKPVLSNHSKIDKIKVLNTNVSSMKVKVLQNALSEHSAVHLTCIK